MKAQVSTTFTPRSFGKIGVEAYAAYALRAWLARDSAISARTRRFAKWSAICSFALGMAGQVAYHLMAQAEMARAPWPVTTIVSCLPVLVLGMGTALAHMLRADAEATDTPDNRTGPPAVLRSLSWSAEDQDGPGRGRPGLSGTGPRGGTRTVRSQDHDTATASPDLACGLPGHRWIRPAWSPAGWQQRGSRYHGGRCAAAESRAPTRP